MKGILSCILEGENGGYLTQYLTGLSGAILLYSAGLHFGWSAPSLKKIMSVDYPFPINEDEAANIVIMGPLGHVMGGLSASLLSDIIGRKKTLLALAMPQLLGFIMIHFSYMSTTLLYLARIAGGIGEGASLALLPVYISEIADPRIRGALGLMSTMGYPIGMLSMNIVGTYIDIHTTALICLIFPILFLIIFSNMPESPYYLLMKERMKETEECLKVLRRSPKIDKELECLKSDVARQLSEPRGFKDIFTIVSNRKALLLVLCARLFQQLTGCSAFGMYLQLLIEQSTNLSPVVGSSLLFLVQISMNILSCFYIDKLGRKPLLAISSGLTATILAILGVFFILRDYVGMDLEHVAWLPLPLMVVFTIAFTFGMGSVTVILISEMFSTSIKSKAIALGSIMYAASMMTTTKYYQFTADNYGLAVPYLTFAICTSIGNVFFRFFLPETKGKTLENIQQVLKGNKGNDASIPI